MPIKNIMTFDKIPRVDSSVDYFNSSDKTIEITQPAGSGWKYQYSFLGNNSIVHVWNKGSSDFDDGYYLYSTSRGDDLINNIIGGGTEMFLDVSDTDTEDQHIDIEFVANDAFLYGGFTAWNNAQPRDSYSLMMLASANELSTSGINDMSIVDGRIKYVGNGGTHTLVETQPALVENKNGNGFWNYDHTNGLTPASNDDGSYDIYEDEQPIYKILNRVYTFQNAGHYEITTRNTLRLYHRHKLRFTAHVQPGNLHSWSCGLTLNMIREKTL